VSKRSETSDSDSTVVDIRIDKEALVSIEKCWKTGRWRRKPRLTFMGYLVEIGLARYENRILPEETGVADQLPILGPATPRGANAEKKPTKK